ncbi:MAG: TonB-dependent receptor, partial [Haliea sp.]
GQTLSTVTVTAGASLPDVLPPVYAGGQVARGGRAGVLGNADFMDSPFAITSLTEEFRQNIQAKSIADVLKYTPSVQTPQLGLAAQNDALNLRGFSTVSGFGSFNGLAGLLNRQSPVEPLERIELLLGASAFANGRVANVGGTTNLVPKRADDAPLTRIGTEYISDSNLGLTADIGRRFGQDNAWGIRVNAAHADGDTAVEHSDRRATTGALGLDWRSDRLRWSFDYIHNQREQSPGGMQYIGLDTGVSVPRAPNADKLFITPGVSRYERKLQLATTRLDWSINDQWDVSAAYGRSRDDDGPSNTLGFYTLLNSAGDLSVNRFISSIAEYENESAELLVRGRLSAGGISHKLTAGFNQFTSEGAFARTRQTFAGQTTNLYNPVPLVLPPLVNAVLPAFRTFDETTTGVFLSNEMGFLDDRLLVTLGVRDTTIETNNYDPASGALLLNGDYKKSALTPAIGVVFKAQPWLSIYGNAVEALESGGRAPASADNPNQAFAPTKSRQYEAGLKADFGKVATTLALFQVERATGYVEGAVGGVGGTFVQDGRQENRGVELSVFGEVQRGLRLYGGLSVVDGKLKRTANGTLDGKKARDIPDYALAATADWDVPGVPGLAVLGGVTRNGKQYYDDQNTVTVPAWTRFDAGVRYTTRIQGKPTVFRFNVENLADKNYFFSDRGDLNLAPPRTFYLSATVDF